MISPRWRKVLRDLWINKTRTLLVVLSIVVGLFAFGTISGTQAVFTREVTRVYLDTNPAHITFATRVDEDFVRAVARMPDVRQAEGRRQFSVRLKSGDARKDVRLVAVADYQNIQINKIVPQSGDWPAPKRELLLERSAAETLGLNTGDWLTLELFDGTQRSLRLAGLAYDLQSPPPGFGSFFMGYITLDTMEWLGQPRDYNRLLVTVNGNPPGKAFIQEIADRITRRLERQGAPVSSVTIPDPGKHPNDNVIQAILLVLGALGGLSLAASAFLVVNMMSAVLAQHLRQIGMMKAVGARTGQVARMYLGMVLTFSALSLVLALPVGSAGAYALTRFAARLLNLEGVDYTPQVSVYAVLAAVAVALPVLAAAWPVLRGSRITVHAAVNAYGAEGQFGRSPADRLIERVRGLPRPVLLSLRNTFRRKGRLALTLSTLTLSGAIFVAVYSVRDSLQLTMADANSYWNYNVSVTFPRFYAAGRLEAEALSVSGVTAAQSWGLDSAQRVLEDGAYSRAFNIVAPPAQTPLLRPAVLQGRWLSPDDTNAIVVNTDILDDQPDLRIGSPIDIRLRERTRTWRVVGIVRGVLTGRNAYVNYPYYASLVGQPGRASSVFVVTDEGGAGNETRIAQALEDHFRSIGMRPASISTTSADRYNIQYEFGLLVTFMLIMALLLAVVGGLGLMGTMSINVIERTREIGVMRAIGASTGSIMQIVVVEGVFIGLISWAQGVVVAWPISRLMGQAIGALIVRDALSYAFSLAGAAIWLLVVVVVAAGASLLPAWNASRVSVRDALAYE